MRDITIPQTLDDPPLAMIFNAYQFMSVIVAAMLGVLFGYILIWAIAGFFVGNFVLKYSEGRPPGFFLHQLYWLGVPLLGRQFPSGLDREFRP